MINNSSYHCCHGRGGISFALRHWGRSGRNSKTRYTLTSSRSNRQRITEKHVIKLGKGRNVYG
ncbi:hypothetical protein ABIB85_008380 [Bradyrhizobium sp. JR1.5]